MRLVCDSAELAAALGVVARALPARTSLPTLGMVLLDAKDDGLLLTATNLELTIRRRLEADVAVAGAVAVPGRLLAEFAGAIPPESLRVELQQPGHRLLLRTGSFRTEIHGAAADEFPPGPGAGGERLAVPTRQLVEAIGDTLVAVSTDEARPVLTGVHLAADGNQLVLAAIDGHRLAMRSLALDPGPALDAAGITVPGRAMAEVARLFRSAEGDVTLTVSPHHNQVVFDGLQTEIASRVIDGTYPTYRRLIPGRWTTSVTVSAAELSGRIRALVPFAHGSANVVRMAVQPGSLVLSAATTDVGSAQTEMEAAVTGPETGLAFNARYLLDCPALATDERVELRLHGPAGPGVVRRTTGEDFVYLFMPVRHSPPGNA